MLRMDAREDAGPGSDDSRGGGEECLLSGYNLSQLRLLRDWTGIIRERHEDSYASGLGNRED